MPKILFGPLHNNSRGFLLEKAGEYLEQGQAEKFCYLAPTPQLLNDFRERLLTNSDLAGTGKLHFYLFDGLFNELLKEGGVYQPVISELEQEIILRTILHKLKQEDKLVYFTEMVEYEGFYKGLLNLIKNLSEHGDNLFFQRDLLKETSEQHKGDKEKELVLIIQKYISYLQERGLIDTFFRYSNLFKLLETEETFLSSLELIIIDGFQKFSGVQYRFIHLLAEKNSNIYININYDKDRPELYSKTRMVFNNLNFEKVPHPVVKGKKGSVVLEHLEKNLFKIEAEQIRADETLKIIETPTRDLEIKQIARECKQLIIAGNYPEDIGIIIRKPELYFDLVERTFSKYGLPYSFMATDYSFLKTPVWKIINDFHRVLKHNLGRIEVLNLLKSNLLNLLKPSEYDEVEIMVNKLRIVRGEDWFRLLGEESPLADKIFKWIKKLINIRFEFIKGGYFEEYAAEIWVFLREAGLEEGIIQEESLQWVNRDLKALDILKQVLLQLSGLIKDRIDINDFFHWLKQSLEKEQIKERPGKGSVIEIMTPSQARGKEYKHLFIIGLLEEEFPSTEKRDWLFSSEEKDRLKEKGFITFSDNEHLLEERFFFYRSLASAEKQLYLSYPSLGAKYGGLLVSSFVNEVKKLFVKDSLEIMRITSTFNLPTTLKEALNLEEARELYLARGSRNYLQTILPALKAEIYRWGNKYSHWDGLLGNQQLIGMITRQYDKRYIFSASELETYANCPFSYFAERVLKLLDLEEPLDRLNALNLGDLYHQILYLYFKEYFPGNWDKEWDRYEKGLKEAAFKVFNKFSGAVCLPDGLWELYQEEVLFNLIEIISNEWEEKGFLPGFLELGFGLNANLEEEGSYNYPEPVEIETPMGLLKFRGKIDRIDISRDRKKAMIWDYKFGNRQSSYQKMVEGFNLQLPLYILIARKVLPLIYKHEIEVIGAAYYSITGNKKDGIWKADYEELIPVTNRSKSCLNNDDWEAHLELFRDYLAGYFKRILEGDFRLEPEDCSNCNYRDICRFAPGRVGGLGV